MRLKKYDEKYMSTIANGAFNEVNNLTVRFESLMGRKDSSSVRLIFNIQ